MPTALFLLSNHPICLYIISSNSLVLKFLIKFSDPCANDSFYNKVKTPIPMHKNRKAKSYFFFDVLNSSDVGSIYRVNMYLEIMNPKNGNDRETRMEAMMPK
jgi:hypothetical protein